MNNNIRFFGKIKFFDYRINHFGFIADVRNIEGILDKDVHVREDNLIDTPEAYKNGVLVSFIIKENKKGYSAFDVKIVSEKDDTYLDAVQLYEKQEQINLLEKYLRSKKDDFDESNKIKILDILKNNDSLESLNLLYKFDQESFSKKLENKIDSFDDSDLYYLSKNKNDKKIIELIAIHWKFSEPDFYTKDFIKELLKYDISLLEISPFTDKLFESKKYLGWYLDEIHRVINDDDEKRKKLKIFTDIFKSKLESMSNDLKIFYLNRFNKSTIYEDILNSYDFEKIEEHNDYFFEPRDSIDDLISFFENRDFKEINIQIFKKNVFNSYNKFTFEQKLKWIFLLNEPKLLLEFLDNFDFESESNFFRTLSFISEKSDDFSFLCSKLPERKVEFWQFIVGIKQNISFEFLNEFIHSTPNYIQFYLLRAIFKFKHVNILSDLQVEELLNVIDFTDLNSKLFLIFLKNPNSNFETLKTEINICFRESLNNQNHSDLYIKDLVKHCSGRARYQGDIYYDSNKQTFSFYGPFYMSKDFEENIFCEGRFWKESSFFNENRNQYTQKKYTTYWCRGKTCYEPNLTIDLEKPVNEWTLLEILFVNNISIEQKYLSLFAGWANRMNEILSRLTCRECNQSLRPVPFEPNRLGFYAVPLFNCLNRECTEYENIIRLTHCINSNCEGKNNRIIDSRDCPKCSNGWLVCQDCFACCPSHHDSKTLSCPNCGAGMSYNNSQYACNNCGNILEKQETELINKFWQRSINYEDRFVNG